MGNRKKNESDTESGEEQEEMFESEQDRDYLLSLPEVEREKILSDRYNLMQQKKEREKFLIDASKAEKLQRIDDFSGKKRDKKSDDLDLPKKKIKYSEPEYDHKKETGITLEDIEKIRISRDQLAK